MDYDALLTQHCPPEIASEVRQAGASGPLKEDIFFKVEGSGSGPVCLIATTLYLSPNITSRASDEAQVGFLGAVATYGALFAPEMREDLETTLRGLTVRDETALVYFTALRETGIDLRPELAGTIIPSWAFAHPRDPGSIYWHYSLYLVSLGEPEALAAVAEKIASTSDATNAYAFLTDLNALPGAQVRSVIAGYQDDERRVRSSSGPGPRLGELVTDTLAARDAR